MGKNQAYKAMQRSRVGSTSAGPDEVEDGMMVVMINDWFDMATTNQSFSFLIKMVALIGCLFLLWTHNSCCYGPALM